MPSPASGGEVDPIEFERIRREMLDALSSMGSVRCHVTEQRCWDPAVPDETTGREPAALLPLLGHATRLAGLAWRGSARYADYTGAAAMRHWHQWRNISAHWHKHAKQFPEYSSVLRYAGGMRRFLIRPPAGTRAATRANGDRMLYHVATDRFGVIGRDGFLKTYFRPGRGDSAARLRYWRRQLEASRAKEWIVK